MSVTLETDAEIRGERREHAATSGGAQNTLLKRGIAVSALVAFAGVALWATMKPPRTKAVAPEKVVIRQTAAFEAALLPVPAPLPVAQLIPAAALPTPPLMPPPEKNDLMDSARRAPVMAFNRQNRAQGTATAGSASMAAYGAQPNGVDDGGAFEKLLKPTVLEGSRAGHIGNRDTIIAMGTSIPCVLETALQSDQPGFATCVINRDVLSDNGRVVLLEKGTQVIGEYRGGLKRGQSRLFVLWNRAKTPTGVIITIASPATDAIGRAGFDGYVDDHWLERFGSALLLSIVSDASQFAGQRLQQSSNIQANGSTQASKQGAAIAVEQSINIPPTLIKHQGELVNIMVGRDLDFSHIYKLRVKSQAELQREFGPPASVNSSTAVPAGRGLKD
jgi:type IV secretion system protein VirB10